MSAEAELAKTWTIFPPDADAPVHLRAISPRGLQRSLPAKNLIFTPAEYPVLSDRCDAVSASALMLNSQGFNLYTCVNPIKPDHVNNSVDDTDIACRRRLLIDIDRRGTLVAPATDHEIEHAERLADRIAARLLDECDAAVFRVMSGNGVHLYLPLQDLPNDSQSKDDCRGLLKGLADEFDNEIVKVDTIVYNASRITKLPGTIMRKGLESPDRPYRMARVV